MDLPMNLPTEIIGKAGKLELKTTRPGSFLAENSEITPENEAQKWVVISHPHPKFGGTMHNKVVTTLEKTFQALGYGTVLYNFRGAGLSEGEYDGGEGEQEDLNSVVSWLRAEQQVSELLLAGFSFGAYISLMQCEQLKPDGLCIVAPPVSMYDFSSCKPTMPWVLVQGGKDEVINAQEVLNWSINLANQPDLYWRAEASHFFHRQLIWLKKTITTAYST